MDVTCCVNHWEAPVEKEKFQNGKMNFSLQGTVLPSVNWSTGDWREREIGLTTGG